MKVPCQIASNNYLGIKHRQGTVHESEAYLKQDEFMEPDTAFDIAKNNQDQNYQSAHIEPFSPSLDNVTIY